MKRIVTMAVALGFLIGAQALAQSKTHTESTTKQSAPGPDLKSKTETVTGTVKEYDAGKKIKISGPNDKTYTFDLDENAQVQGTIAVGQMAGTSLVNVFNEGDLSVATTIVPEFGVPHDPAYPGGTSVNWTREGFALHPEWRTDPNYGWTSDGNVLLKALRILQEKLDTEYQGRSP